jgi:carboxypeptidase Taq
LIYNDSSFFTIFLIFASYESLVAFGSCLLIGSEMKFVSDSYASLLTKLNAICQLKRCQSVLTYDQMVFMPKNPQTAAERGAQLSALAGLIHEKSTDKDILRLIEKSMEDLQQAKIDNNKDTTCTDLLFSDESRVLELERKTFWEMERVPTALAEKRAALSAKAHQVWATARQKDDFPLFAPVLSECFQTSKELAVAKRGDDETKTLYNQMLDEFEPGMAVDRIDEIFQQIRDALVPFISKVLSSPYKPSTKLLKDGKFPIEKQKEVGKKIVEAMGFKEEFGRIDVSVHPFTSSSSPYDVRITSRFSEDEWKEGLTATIHEAGHG